MQKGRLSQLFADAKEKEKGLNRRNETKPSVLICVVASYRGRCAFFLV